jgi:thymidylate kinase
MRDISAVKTRSANTIPRFIYFAGVDGSGKSTYAEMLIKEFERRGLKAKRVWLRFNYFFAKPVLLYCRLTGLTRRPIRGGRKISVHDFYKSPCIGAMVQYLHLVDTCLKYIFKIYLPLKFTGTYILCDRFAYDILADFMIENRDMDLPKKLIGKLLLKLLPADALVLYFKVDKEEIIRRKPEVLDDDEDYDLKYTVYRALGKEITADVIDNNKEPSLVFDRVAHKIFAQNMLL